MNGFILPIIPSEITVHLGDPSSNAENITVPFDEYIKNVASSEIYPTWPREALKANILAQTSFALNRVYNEYYRSRGYDFDITSTTSRDQSFVKGREYFENVSEIVDELFGDYIARTDSVSPLFAQYCNGTTTLCDGLSQWGSSYLAEDGLSAIEILKSYYGNDIEIRSAEIGAPFESYPGIPLSLGSGGDDVRLLAIRLNRISTNFPSSPKIYPIDGIFDSSVRDAVIEFQKTFGLTPDGIVGKATWYKIISTYTAVKKLSELIAENLTFDEVSKQFEEDLRLGDSGKGVDLVQYYLEVVSSFDPTVSYPPLDSYFGKSTEDSVKSFQKTYGLPVTGIVDLATYEKLFDAYASSLASLPESVFNDIPLPFPGIVLREGSSGEDVLILNDYLRVVNSALGLYSSVPETDYFGTDTARAVRELQGYLGLNESGAVTPITWDRLADLYGDITAGYTAGDDQYPGEAIE